MALLLRTSTKFPTLIFRQASEMLIYARNELSSILKNITGERV
jgi:hypothetical protein